MEWTITIRDQYVEIVTKGVADRNASLDMARAITMTMRKNRIKKALIDQTNIDSVAGKTVDIYQRPKQLQEMGMIQGLSIAEIIRPEHKDLFDFLETVCTNRGIGFATFHDRGSALEWLLEQ